MQKSTKDSITNKKINKKGISKASVQESKDLGKVSTSKSISTTKKSSAAAKNKSTKSSTSKAVKNAKKPTSNKKSTTKKSSSKKSSNSKKTNKSVSKTTTKSKKKIEIIEYYDLPYRYNQTVVKILAQTPNTIFVYWDISDSDREKYLSEYGKNFFQDTTPILVVHNKTMNYSFEIEINDFANSWYFSVNDSKCDYEIELGRRSKNLEIALPNNYLYVTSSNIIETPNNHILFEKNQKTLFFRNVKTNYELKKDIPQLEFMKYAGRIYNIYDVYKKIYKAEELENIRNNPTSSFN